MASLSLTGIASVSAADAETAQTQTSNISTVQKKVNIKTNDTNIINNSTTTRKLVGKSLKHAKKHAKHKKIHSDKNAKNTVKHLMNNYVKNSGLTKCPALQNACKNTNSTVKAITQNTANETTIKNDTQTQPITNDTSSTITNQTTVTSLTNQSSTNNESNQSTVNTTQINEVKTQQAAAGETKTATSQTVNSTSFTVSQIKDATARVKSHIEANKKLPEYVTVGTTQVGMSDFLKLLTVSVLNINNGTTTTQVALKTVNTPAKPSESVKSGNINKAGYIDLAKRVNAFIDANGKLPNYATSTLGKLRYKSLIYMYSKILSFYNTNNRLPSYVSVKAWSTVSSTGSSTTTVPAELQQYLKATTNCQVTNAQIKALSTKITSGKTSTYDKAVAIFNWVRDNIGYSFYYNTQKGAVGALNAKTANCCDTAHLLIALERAAGIPARYVHGNAKFTSGNTYGHVWAEVYANGKWYKADASSSKNSFGAIKSWTSATIKGRYVSLSF